MTTRVDKVLRRIYYDETHEASFASAQVLYAAVKHKGISLNQVKKWLQSQETFTLHKQRRKNFTRNPVVVNHIDEQWQADIVDMTYYKDKNNQFNYMLTMIDVMSKYAFAIPLKSKSGANVAKALETVFKKRRPAHMQTDKGLEFRNRSVKTVLDKYGIIHFTTLNTETKCAVVERYNRTLRNKMFKYFTSRGTTTYVDVLKNLVDSINRRKCRTIGMAPASVKPEDEKLLFKRLYGFKDEREMLMKKKSKPDDINVGDKVRITCYINTFDTGYLPNWTDEMFTVAKITRYAKKNQYQLRDYKGELIEGRFYAEEIQKVLDNRYRVERILNHRTHNGVKQVRVKWLNFDNSYNSWINESSMKDLTLSPK